MNLNRIISISSLVFILWACGNDEPEWQGETVQSLSGAINAIAVDNNNTKWIGTDNGLYRSVEEGYQSIVFPSSGKVHALLYEKQGNQLWIGTENGISNAVLSDNDFVLTDVAGEKLSNKQANNFYTDENSKLWIGTQQGITLNYNDTWKKEKFRVNEEGRMFTMDAEDFAVNSISSWDGDYFFATSGAKLYRATGYDSSIDAFTGATQWDFPYNGLSITDTMFVVFVDNAGQKWMGGTEGIQIHTGHDAKDHGSFTYYYDELPDPYILAINQAPNNKIWVGTRKGLAIFDGSNWSTVTEGIPDLYITAIEFDNDGSAWIGTKKGLAHIGADGL